MYVMLRVEQNDFGIVDTFYLLFIVHYFQIYDWI